MYTYMCIYYIYICIYVCIYIYTYVRLMTLLASSSEFECPTDTVACAMKPEHLGGCSQSVQSGVAPDCSGSNDSIGKFERV